MKYLKILYLIIIGDPLPHHNPDTVRRRVQPEGSDVGKGHGYLNASAPNRLRFRPCPYEIAQTVTIQSLIRGLEHLRVASRLSNNV
jgi:hypothetical protein